MRKFNLGLGNYLMIADIAKDCFKRIKGGNYPLVEELFYAKTKEYFKDEAQAKRFLFNHYIRTRKDKRK